MSAMDADAVAALGFDQSDLLSLTTTVMPFGKYQGRVIINLPEEYLFWFRKNGFPAGRLGLLMALALELKIEGLDSLLKPLTHTSELAN